MYQGGLQRCLKTPPDLHLNYALRVCTLIVTDPRVMHLVGEDRMLSIFIIRDILLQQQHIHSLHYANAFSSGLFIILVNEIYQRSMSLSAIGWMLAV